MPNFGEFRLGGFDYSQRVVTATIQDDDDLPAPAIILVEVLSVLPQDGADPLLLIVGGDKQDETLFCVFGHAVCLP